MDKDLISNLRKQAYYGSADEIAKFVLWLKQKGEPILRNSILNNLEEIGNGEVTVGFDGCWMTVGRLLVEERQKVLPVNTIEIKFTTEIW